MPHAVNPVLAPRFRSPVAMVGRGSVARKAVRVVTGVSAVVAAVALAYLLKSALRIDILPGPSPLHDILYPIIERLR